MNLPPPSLGPNPEAGDLVDAIEASPVPAAPTSAYHLIRDVEVEITLEIGRRRMRIADVLKLAPGQTLALTKAAGEPLDLYVNGRLLGRGEAVVLGDRYGVRITELVAEESGRTA
ncbi:MAG: flagellar motor switch protein FliN [Polyangiales bacterium]